MKKQDLSAGSTLIIHVFATGLVSQIEKFFNELMKICLNWPDLLSENIHLKAGFGKRKIGRINSN